MNVLVLGGAGYIGSHMLLSLKERGWNLTVFDNLSRGYADAVGDACLIVGDLKSPTDIARCLNTNHFDLVFHFAALAYVRESMDDPETYYQNNVAGTLNLLEGMRARKMNRIIFSSTCATYGTPIQIPILESHPQAPINPYGRTKLFIEHVLKDYAHAYGINSISLRYFNAAGCDLRGRAGERHAPETHIIPLILEEALRTRQGGNPSQTNLKIFGLDLQTRDGSCIRDFIHVNDLCAAHLAAGDRLLEGCAGAEFYNLANGSGFTLLELIGVCRSVTGQPIQFHEHPAHPGDPAQLVGNSSLAETTLRWSPKVTSLDAIVQSAWNWMSRPNSD